MPNRGPLKELPLKTVRGQETNVSKERYTPYHYARRKKVAPADAPSQGSRRQGRLSVPSIHGATKDGMKSKADPDEHLKYARYNALKRRPEHIHEYEHERECRKKPILFDTRPELAVPRRRVPGQNAREHLRTV